VAPQKGRLQEGCDADIVVFDAATISDRATFERPMEPSVGVRYLVVGGTLVVMEGRLCRMLFEAGDSGDGIGGLRPKTLHKDAYGTYGELRDGAEVSDDACGFIRLFHMKVFEICFALCLEMPQR
jgi:hypothetical protein